MEVWFLVDARNEQAINNITRINAWNGTTYTTTTPTSNIPPFGNSTLVTYGTSTTYATNFYSYYRLVTIGIYNSGTGYVNINEVVMNGVYV